MAIQILGIDGTTVQAVDPQSNAARIAVKPVQCLGWNSVAAASGLITGIAAGTALFSFRNLAANPIMVRRVGVGFICLTAFTVAQRMEFGLIVARSFTSSDTGGTTLNMTGSNGKHRTSLATPTSLDCRISTTVALTPGIKVLDAVYLGLSGFFAGGVGFPVSRISNLFDHDPEDYPLILAQNEGFNVINNVLMGAAGVGVAYINMEFAEVASY